MKRLRPLLIVLLPVLLGGLAYYLLVMKNGSDGTAESQLTGVAVQKDMADRPVLGIMVENSPPARPQTGLTDAGIVFETVTEGGITRYLALYQETMPDVVGPVRSLRPYFLDWMMGFDASVAHVGGSPEALKLADQREAKSLNQFKYGEPYYRTSDRSAPHNMYVRTADLRKLQAELGIGKSSFNEFDRSNDHPSKSPQARTVAIDYSSPTYATEFHYLPDKNKYARYLAGSAHTDRETGKQIEAKNVVVLKLKRDGNKVDATGSGEALIFKDGDVIKARWVKETYSDSLKLVDTSGEAVPLNRGSTWIAGLPEDKSVTY